MYTIEQLKHDVLTEANNIKQHATEVEKAYLDFNTLDPSKMDKCIYGQMTGNCDSTRSIELISKCACRFIVDSGLTSIKAEGFERIQRKVNGEVVEDLQFKRLTSWSNYQAHFSAIEAYILLPEAKNADLIAFIKGESDTVEL